MFDDIHGRHCQAGAVDHTADVAVKSDVAEVELRGLHLFRILLGHVTHCAHVGVTEERVVIKSHLSVQSDEIPGFGQDQWIDLDQGRIAFDERPVERAHERDCLADRVLGQAQAIGEFPALEVRKTRCWVNSGAQNLLRRACRDLFDLDSPFGASHHRDPERRPVNDHAEVILFGDVAALLDKNFLDRFALRAGLVGDQFFA